MRRGLATNEFYHLFNRGVDKRKIFLDKSDYIRFIHNLYEFNDVNPASAFCRRKQNVGFRKPYIKAEESRRGRDLLVNVHAFAMMPNHHHKLAEQLKEGGISLYMKKIHAGYANAFNLKQKRSGHLFQGSFKDVHIEGDTQLAYLVCYIHSNPLDIWKSNWKEKKLTEAEIKEALKFLEKYRWSSHLDYLGIKNFPSVIYKDFLFKFFGGSEGYKKFFIDWLRQYEDKVETIQDFILE